MGEVDLWGDQLRGQTYRGQVVDLPTDISYVELGKFDPPLWHVPYGRIV